MTEKSAETDATTWTKRTRARLMSTAEGRAALAEAEEREKRLVQQPCRDGNCVELIDPLTGENKGGWGPIWCPCQGDDTALADLADTIEDAVGVGALELDTIWQIARHLTASGYVRAPHDI